MGRHNYGWAKNSNMKKRTKFDKKNRTEISKQNSKHQNCLKYLLIIYPNIQARPIYMLCLDILTYVIKLYVIYYLDFEKFKVYDEF